MADPPIISDVWRVTVNYANVGGVRPVNVFHLRSPSGDREEIADAIRDACDGKVLMNGMSPDFAPSTFTLLPLDGASASSVHDIAPSTWGTSSADGDWSPATAAVVSLRTAVRGPRGRGRLYIGPIVEEGIANGSLLGDTPVDLADAWASFGADLASGDPAIALGVASYVHEDFNPLIGLSVSPIVGTQRRRQDQLR